MEVGAANSNSQGKPAPKGNPLQRTAVTALMSTFASEDEGMELGQVANSPLPPNVIEQTHHAFDPRGIEPAAKIGRPQSMIWNEYIQEDVSGKQHKRALCRHCKRKRFEAGKPGGNMLRHTRACTAVPAEVKQRVEEEFAAAAATRTAASAPSHPAAAPSSATASPIPEPPASQEEFEKLVAMYFYTGALPFAQVEGPSSKAIFAAICPTLTVPNRHKLAGPLLKAVKKDVETKVKELVSAERYVSIVSDGWSDQNSASIVKYVVATPGMPSVLWGSKYTKSEQKNAEYMTQEITRIIDEVESTTGAAVGGVMTDNAKVMIAARKKLEKEKGVIAGVCAAHVLNLLVGDIASHARMRKVKELALKFVRFVRDHPAVLDRFRDLQLLLITPPTPRRGLVNLVLTRWYGLHAMLRSVMGNKQVLSELFLGEANAELLRRNDTAAKKVRRGEQRELFGTASTFGNGLGVCTGSEHKYQPVQGRRQD